MARINLLLILVKKLHSKLAIGVVDISPISNITTSITNDETKFIVSVLSVRYYFHSIAGVQSSSFVREKRQSKGGQHDKPHIHMYEIQHIKFKKAPLSRSRSPTQEMAPPNRIYFRDRNQEAFYCL